MTKPDPKQIVEALVFYADPETYHACSFAFDRPTGGFDEDFDTEHGHERYPRPMPGKKAREALAQIPKQHGFILLPIGSRPMFRQYAPDGSFEDYEIRHSDLEVIIVGEHKLGQDPKGTLILDHSDETLGKDHA